ncbi:class I SAM-dependent methyltransferase [Pararhizobium sp. BT-229]|uniref:class I SAM-dependent methyltransferase n=1 Tax=Pararhizobium sp. BT-229 TaxID=2986923 RepID=UPI0021F6BCDB|nr:class I SAM-dependent methyltransferase [Pararhizobium sp. BT-229]MCV9961605.1 class I SAM-dependent methyltransferase [Pararhizobium sp. BT-229]
MSRLDSFISRMHSQRAVLNHIKDQSMIGPDGVILEIGLGNGRTYDHIRELFPDNRIIVFDRAVGSHPDSTPPEADLILGDIKETIRRFDGKNIAFAHADIGTAYPEKDAKTLTWLPQSVAAALRSGGIAASGLPLDHPELEPLPLPAGAEPGRTYFYRKR